MQEIVGQINFGALQGIIAGIIFFLGVSIITLLPRYKWLAAGLLLVLITPIALAGFWFSTGKLGISDWDYYFSMHENLRKSLLVYKDFPFWNPYTCGGTAGLADPEFPLFTPTFLLELIFGIPVGFRLAIYLSVATTALGMLMLAKSLKLSVYAALLASAAAVFGSVNLLEIVEGHPNIFAAMWIPWIFWAWLGSYHHPNKLKNWSLFCGIFLALTFFQGGIYLLSYAGLAFIVLIALAKNHKTALVTSILAGLWAGGFAAVKLIPVLLWLQEFQDASYAGSTYTLRYLHEILLGRHLHGIPEIIANQGSSWHEYGAYIGPAVLLLAAASLYRAPKKRMIRILAISAVAATLLSSSGPLLKPIFDQAPFIPRSNISRVILFAVIPLALLAGHGLDIIRQGIRKTSYSLATITTVLIVGIVATDLMSLAYQLSEQAFVLPEVTESIPPAPYPIAFTAHTYAHRHGKEDYTRAYAATLAGYGTLSYCSVLTPPPMVRTIHDEVDTDIISVPNKGATYQLLHWSPNTVRIRITTPEQTPVTLNTNYAKGWFVYLERSETLSLSPFELPQGNPELMSNGSKSERSRKANNVPAISDNGRVSTTVPAGTHEIVFHFKAFGFVTGLIVTLVTILCAVALLSYSTRRSLLSTRK